MFVVQLPKSGILISSMLIGICLASITSVKAEVFDEIKVCRNYLDVQDFARAEVAANKILQSEKLSRKEQFWTQLCLANAYADSGQVQKARPVFEKVESLAESKAELLQSYSSSFRVYLALREFDRAELYAQRGVNLAKELDSKGSQAANLSNLASVALARGDAKHAVALYQQVLDMEVDESRQAIVLSNIASAYSGHEQYLEATKYQRQALKLARKSGNSHQTAQFQILLGGLLSDQGKLSDAEKELTAGLSTMRLLGDKKGEADACLYLGIIAGNRKKGPQMIDWYKKAEALYREIGYVADADQLAKLISEN